MRVYSIQIGLLASMVAPYLQDALRPRDLDRGGDK